MERIIKFRGKSPSTGEWVYGYYYASPMTFNGSTELFHAIVDNTGFIFKVDPTTVGQYTGLIDKNSKEMFEGDVIKTENGSITHIVYQTAYGQVIGNIHDNPTLLTQ